MIGGLAGWALACSGGAEPEPMGAASAPLAEPSAEWPLDQPCEASWIRPLAASTAAVTLPRCDVPEGSVRQWMRFEHFAVADYPNGPPGSDAVERVCADGTYQQAIPSVAGVYVARVPLKAGLAEGAVELGFEGSDRQLTGAFAAGAADGEWRWDTTADTVGFPACASQSGRYAAGKREGSWHFEEFFDGGSAKVDLAFAGGRIEGPVKAELGVGGERGTWTGEAKEDERHGTWTFHGDADLQGVEILEQWDAGRLVSRVVTPGPCATVPEVGGSGELCASP